MSEPEESKTQPIKKIVIRKNGPYRVEGNIPLVKKEQVVSEFGEPLTWKKGEVIETEHPYMLCRCGRSKELPFCDKTHREIDFDGTETADERLTAERQIRIRGGKGIVVRRDRSLCMDAGFCGNRLTNIDRMTPNSDDTSIRAQIMAMIERCPSGSYVYALDEDGPDVEPDLPEQIAVTIEITSNGPIDGPLWVTGNIEIVRSDNLPVEKRNRVTLCNCGKSKNKPFCDGTHRPKD
jgi:CDGSH-type Zn-finger protein